MLAALIVGGLYAVNISGWLMHDDEGTDFYEVWRFAEGDRPGVDYIAEQQPLFLMAGAAIVQLFGRDPAPLRLLSAAHVLAGAYVLVALVATATNQRTGLLMGIVVLSNSMIFEQARLFRPDPMMLAWEMVGLGLAFLASGRAGSWLWAAAGAAYGVAFLWKPLAALPVVGVLLYFGYRLAADRVNWRGHLRGAAAFVAGFLLFALAISAGLYAFTGFYYGEVFGQHASLGREQGTLTLLLRTAAGYLLFFTANALFLFIPALAYVNRRMSAIKPAAHHLLGFQLLAPAALLALSRPLHLRYFIFLVPPLALLLAIQFDALLVRANGVARARAALVAAAVLVFVASVILSSPGLPNLLSRTELDSRGLAELVAAHTGAADLVLSDYAGINFLAGRASIPEASIIAGGRIEGGIVTGAMLLERIEHSPVELVLIHVEGGEPPAHHLVKLPDYRPFLAGLEQKFDFWTEFERAGQVIQIYRRK